MESQNAQDFLSSFRNYASNVQGASAQVNRVSSEAVSSKLQGLLQKQILQSDAQREQAQAVAAFSSAAGFIPQGLKEFKTAVGKLKKKLGKDTQEATTADDDELVDVTESKAKPPAPKISMTRGIRDVKTPASTVKTATTASSDIGSSSGAGPSSAGNTPTADVKTASPETSIIQDDKAGAPVKNLAQNVSDKIDNVASRLSSLRAGKMKMVSNIQEAVKNLDPEQSVAAAFDNSKIARAAVPPKPVPSYTAPKVTPPAQELKTITQFGKGKAPIDPNAPKPATTPDVAAPKDTPTIKPGNTASKLSSVEDTAAKTAADSGVKTAVEDVAEKAGTSALKSAALGTFETLSDFAGPIGILVGIISAGAELASVFNKKAPPAPKQDTDPIVASSFGRVQKAVAPSVNTAATITAGYSGF